MIRLISAAWVRSVRSESSRRSSQTAYEALWLPLAQDGITVNMLMGCLFYLEDWAQALPENDQLQALTTECQRERRPPRPHQPGSPAPRPWIGLRVLQRGWRLWAAA